MQKKPQKLVEMHPFSKGLYKVERKGYEANKINIHKRSKAGQWLEKSVPWCTILYSEERQKGIRKQVNRGDQRESGAPYAQRRGCTLYCR